MTPFFNGGAIFYETSESVFRQTLQQWEWIIVNDGSTQPEALRILEEYRHKDPRIRVVDHPQNKGLSAARNTGFREARTDYVFQLDADDLIEPTTLEKMAWHLATRPEVAFTTGFTVGFGSLEYVWNHGFHDGPLFLKENPVTATCLVRKTVHKAVGGYEENIKGGLEDWDFWMRSASLGHWGTTIPEYFDWYRRRDAGREHWDNVTQQDKFDKFRDRLRQKYPNLWQGAFPQILPSKQQPFFSPPTELPFENKLTRIKPRLLFILPHFELGGADKFNIDLIRQLQKNEDWEVTVVSTLEAKDVWLHEFENLTPDVFALHRFLDLTDFPRFLSYLINSRQPDAICTSNSHLGYQLLPFIRANFPQIPILDYLHMEEEAVGGGYPRCSLLYQSQLAKTVVSSQHLKNWLVTRGSPAERVEVCTTNIDPAIWSRDRFDKVAIASKWKVDLTRPVILYAGRICDQKQPKVFAEVMAELALKSPHFTTLVAGDGPDLQALINMVQTEQIKQVRFLGAVSNQDMAELLAISDIFFLPSKWEGISLAIYEAMAMETVLVGADVGGQRELVTSDCGILVRPGVNEVKDYVSGLQRLLKAPEQRKRMATAARSRIVEKFDIKELGRRMRSIFEDARNVVTVESSANVPSKSLAMLHTTETLEQIRTAAYSQRLILNQQNLLYHTKSNVEWQAELRAGRKFVELKMIPEALQSFKAGVAAAAACGMGDIELTARVELAQAMIPLDRKLAEQTLTDALRLTEGLPDNQPHQSVLKLIQLIRKAPEILKNDAIPKVSVIIPCYKQANFLPDAVGSVVAQTFTDWEIIIVNDGSPDNTSEVARGLMAKYPDRRIRLVEKVNGGLASARNAGFRASQAKYVLPLDADDMIKPTHLSTLTEVLDKNPKVGFAYTHIHHFGDVNTVWPLPDFNAATLIGKDNIVICCSLCRKSMWEAVGGYNENMREGYEDWDFWIGCVEHGWTGHCHHEALFLYRKHGHTMVSEANLKRERLIAQIVSNHPKLYDQKTLQWSRDLLAKHAAEKAAAESAAAAKTATEGKTEVAQDKPAASVKPERARLRITYLIESILGVTGGNQTLLRQAAEMHRRGHEITIVTYTQRPDWFKFQMRVIQIPAGKQMSEFVPPSDVVVATYFTNAHQLPSIKAPVKVYYAQGDQFIFADSDMADTPEVRAYRQLSKASYLLPGIRFVPNSNNLARAVQKLCGRGHDAILPVCTDQTIFRPLQHSVPGSRFRLLIVGPDARGTATEPLNFKGMQDIHDALQILARKYPHFTPVRMSGTGPDIFAKTPCEFYIAPNDEMKTVLFGTSHIHIYASHYDSCPRPPQEAMAAGCAVVCTATSGAMEYCRDGENALLVPIKSPEAIASAVERLIHDHALREKLIQGGLETARAFPREREWNEWENILFRFVDETVQSASKAKTVTKQATIQLPACALVGHLAEARELLKKRDFKASWKCTIGAIQLRPYHPEAFLLLGEIALATGDSVSARQCGQHAAKLAPDWKLAKQFLKGNLRGNAKHEWLHLPQAVNDSKNAGQPRLSVCLIAKNEEKFLGKCLESVRGLASQIVVVDTGSTDRTVEIAKEHGAEIHEFKWCDDFSAARNSVLEHATGDWILFLDADEELSPNSRETILQEIRSTKTIGYRLPIVDEGREAEGCSYVPRLFRNAPGLFFVGRVHEQVFSSLEVRSREWGLENSMGKSTLLHHGYTQQMVVSRDKVNRNLRLLELAIEELPGEPSLMMNWGLELVRAGQLGNGIDKYRQAMDLMSDLPADQVTPELRETLITQYATNLLKAGRHGEIVSVLQSPHARKAGLTASQHFILGLALLDLKQPVEAAVEFRQCLAKRHLPVLSPINKDILKGGPQHCLALALEACNDAKSAEAAYRSALVDDPAAPTILFDFAKFQFKQGQPIEALQTLNGLVADHPGDASIWQLGTQIALSNPEFIDFAIDWTGEALKYLPEDQTVIQSRAGVLLLSQQPETAMPLWASIKSRTARQTAALTICEVLGGTCQQTFSEMDERAVSREFLNWYRQFIQQNAKSLITRLNDNLEGFRAVIPSAANLLETAIKEAEQPMTA